MRKAISAVVSITHLDHLVLTVRDVAATCDFYTRVLGMQRVTFGGDRIALHFGSQKINLHPLGKEIEPHAAQPTSGAADLCFLTATPLSDVVAHLADHGIEIIEGPVRRTGATGLIDSVYIRDPDGNLLELSNMVAASSA
ncbi:MAG: VOC family protein [Cyanobacteria bacterium J06638_22]